MQQVDQYEILSPIRNSDIDSVQNHDARERVIRLAPAEFGKTAIVSDGTSYSYAQLHDGVSESKESLIAFGSQRGHRILFEGPVNVQYIAYFQAALELGLVLVPVSSQEPTERRSWMIDVVGATACFDSRSGLSRLFPNDPKTSETSMDQLLAPFNLSLSKLVTRSGEPGAYDPATLFFTSGSSGKPKPVLGTYGSLAHFLDWERDYLKVTCEDRCSQLVHPAFDAFLRDVLLPLTSGATLVLPDDVVRCQPELVWDWLQEEAISIVHAVPSIFKTWLNFSKGDSLYSLRHLLLSGEAIQAPFVESTYASLSPGALIHNLYGPTETMMIKSACPIPRNMGGRSISIGRPLPDTSITIVPREGMFDELQGVGELVIETPWAGLGYLDSKGEKTAFRWGVGQEGMTCSYATGDFGFYDGDGALCLLGRGDQRAKIHGRRFDPLEIETYLDRHPIVASAAVCVHSEPGGDILIAFVTLTDHSFREKGTNTSIKHLDAANLNAIRVYLSDHLPLTLVPSRFYELRFLPMKPNGKLDRLHLKKINLPQCDVLTPDRTNEDVDPALLCLWRDVLGCSTVNPDSDFFLNGGTSLKAMRLLGEIASRFKKKMSIRDLFENPNPRALMQRLENLPESMEPNHSEGLVAVSTFPLSGVQKGLWFLDNWDSKGEAYVLSKTFSLKGLLDPSRLEKAITHVLAHCGVFRARFSEGDGMVRQWLEPSSTFELTVCAYECEDSENRLIAQMKRAFNLQKDALIRCALLRRSTHSFVFCIAAHHIVADETSLQILVKRIVQAYIQDCQNALKPGDGYEHYLKTLQEQETYTGKQPFIDGISHDIPLINLPYDCEPQYRRDLSAGETDCVIENTQWERFKELSLSNGLTPFMALGGILAILLNRVSGDQRVIIGSPVSIRGDLAEENLVACLLNMLPFVYEPQPDLRLGDYLEYVKDVGYGTLDAKSIPFHHLIEKIQPPRAVNRHPFFDVVLNFLPNGERDTTQGDMSEVGVTMSQLKRARRYAKQHLTFYVKELGSGLKISLVYQNALFKPRTAQHFLSMFGYLLTHAPSCVHKPLNTLHLSPPTQNPVLKSLQTAFKPSFAPSVVDLFLEKRDKDPTATALIHERVAYSRGQIWEKVLNLSRAITARGVLPGQVVAFEGPRCPARLVSLLASFYGGFIHVFIDPQSPPQRHKRMVREANVALLMTTANSTHDSQIQTLKIASDGSVDNPIPASNRALERTKGTMDACIFFTSGSTGEPKPLIYRHEAISHFLLWEKERFGVTHRDRCSQLIAATFDAVLRDLLLPIMSGAILVIPPETLRPEDTCQWLSEARITLIHSVPSKISGWLGFDSVTKLSDVRLLALSGESIHQSLIQQWRQQHGLQARIVNLYGPSETTMVKCAYEIPIDVPQRQFMSAGQTIPGCQVAIMDESGRLCESLEVGEIVLRTPHSARYLKPSRARGFVQNPFRNEASDFLYKTGDLGRIDGDGCLHVFGRKDRQLKIAGMRIEAAEIEAVLCQAPSVSRAAIVWDASNQLLKAFIEPVSDKTPDRDALYRHCIDYLVPAAIPASFHLVKVLPLLESGKLDQKTVSQFQGKELTHQLQHDASPYFQAMSSIWSDVLKVKGDGNAHFFSMGGNSLKAMQILGRVQSFFGVDVSIREFFMAGTVNGLAQWVFDRRSKNANLCRPVLRRFSRDTTQFPLSHQQEAFWLLYRLNDSAFGYHMHEIQSLEMKIDRSAFETAVQQFVARHQVLSMVVNNEEPASLKMYGSKKLELVWHDLCDLSKSRQDEAVKAILRQTLRKPFELEKCPPYRMSMLQLDSDRYIFVSVFHHMVFDRHSKRIFRKEWPRFYEAALKGRSASFKPLQLEYKDYAHAQREWLGSQDYQEQLGYWEEQLDDLSGKLLFEKRMTRQKEPVDLIRFEIAEHLVAPFLEYCQKHGATPFMGFLGLFSLLLEGLSGQNDVITVIPVSNRYDKRLEGLIGCFANMIPIRVKTHKEKFPQLLKAIRETVLDALAYGEVPFEKIVEMLHQKGGERHPIGQAIFSLREARGKSFTNSFVKGRSHGNDSARARADIEMHLVLREGKILGHLSHRPEAIETSVVKQLSRYLEQLTEWVLSSAPLSDLPKIQRPKAQTSLMPLQVDERTVGTLGDLLQNAAATGCDQAFTFLDNLGQSYTRSYQDLLKASQSLAECLYATGLNCGDPVLYQFEDEYDLLVAFWGCQLGGFVAVPAPWFLMGDLEQVGGQLQQLGKSLGNGFLLTHSKYKARVDNLEGICPGLSIDPIFLDTVEPKDEPTIGPIDPTADALYLLTSGSTGLPKLVRHSHKTLLLWLEASDFLMGGGPDSTLLNWFPLTHVGALVMLHLTGVKQAAKQIHWPSHAILGQPLKWLDLIDQHRVNLAWAPNFAFGLVNEHMHGATGKDWDLSSVHTIINGGEAITPRTARAFLKNTMPFKFPEYAMVPMWGMSETSSGVVVSRAFRLETTDDNQAHTNLGVPIPGCEIRILKGVKSVLCDEEEVGRVQIRAPFLTKGYLGRPELNNETFSRDGWMETGDLGFLKDGRLTLTGRNKDVIIVHGNNFSCYEIEALVEDIEGVERSFTAAFAARGEGDDTDQLALVIHAVLPAAELQILFARIRSVLQGSLAVGVRYIVVLPKDEIPKTAIGKLKRSRLAEAFHQGLYKPFCFDMNASIHDSRLMLRPETESERALFEVWKRLLEIEQFSVDDNLFGLGAHSFLIARAHVILEKELKRKLAIGSLYQHASVRSFAQFLDGTMIEEKQKIRPKDDLVFDETIAFPRSDTQLFHEPQNILLTGANGYLGNFMVEDLMKRTNCQIYCLIRCATPEAGMKRLTDSLARRVPDLDICESRIHIIPGDLNSPELGMTAARWTEVSEIIDTIYHVGASVALNLRYADLRRANVVGTKNVLKLMGEGRSKVMHFISSLGVYSRAGYEGVPMIYTDDDLSRSGRLSGYARSKWVADKLVMEAINRGAMATIFRVGRIAASQRTGVGNPGDFINLVLKTCARLGTAPDLGDYCVEQVPVDGMCRAIVALGSTSSSNGKRFHLHDPHGTPFMDQVSQLQKLGIKIDVVSLEIWHDLVLDYASRHRDDPQLDIVVRFARARIRNQGHVVKAASIDVEDTGEALAKLEVPYPMGGEVLVSQSLKYLKEIGVFG